MERLLRQLPRSTPFENKVLEEVFNSFEQLLLRDRDEYLNRLDMFEARFGLSTGPSLPRVTTSPQKQR